MSTGNLSACLDVVFKWEGGYVNNPHDPGGPTNKGITLATLSHELGRAATIEEVKNLTSSVAADIYRKKYWNLIDGNALPAGVDLIAFDIAVNSGCGRALQWLKETASLEPVARVHALDARRRSFWRALASFSIFGKGWFRREDDVYAQAMKMLSGQMFNGWPENVKQPSISETQKQGLFTRFLSFIFGGRHGDH